jgi:hypothetical protein
MTTAEESAEHEMEQLYLVKRNGNHQWVVSAAGEEILSRTRKGDAPKACRAATALLYQLTIRDNPRDRQMKTGSGNQLIVSNADVSDFLNLRTICASVKASWTSGTTS